MTILENISLADRTTLGVGGAARYFCEVTSEAEVVEAATFARERGLRVFVLGGGSNVLVHDAGFEGLVIRVAIWAEAAEVVGKGTALVIMGAGVVWDEFVRSAVGQGIAGIECLAGIPGDVGGTPVQNVGAYGQEVSTTIVCVRAFDLESFAFVELDREACAFSYRRSIFNTTARGRYIVTAVTYRLRINGMPAFQYPDLRRRFAVRLAAGDIPTLLEVYDVVRSIREKKGMLAGQGGEDSRSAGSFFKNPIVDARVPGKIALVLGIYVEEVIRWPAGDGMVKLSAAWLVERAGFVKGLRMGNAGISTKHTLALVNLGGATAAEIMALRDAVLDGVEHKFGMRLEQEPTEMGS